MKPEDSHVYCYNSLGKGVYELVAEYQGFPLLPLKGTTVIHNPSKIGIPYWGIAASGLTVEEWRHGQEEPA